MNTMWIIKLFSLKEQWSCQPIEVYNSDYSMIETQKSLFVGIYSSPYVANFKSLNNEIVTIPWKNATADKKYGYYIFNSKKELKKFMVNNKKMFLDVSPEYFI